MHFPGETSAPDHHMGAVTQSTRLLAMFHANASSLGLTFKIIINNGIILKLQQYFSIVIFDYLLL